MERGPLGRLAGLAPNPCGVAGSPGGLRVPKGGGISGGGSHHAPKVSRSDNDAGKAWKPGESPEGDHALYDACNNTFREHYMVGKKSRKRKHRNTSSR